MSDMSGTEHLLPETGEWREFRAHADRYRRDLERALRRRLVHDARAATARVHDAAVDLADEALVRTLDEWRAKPSGTSPALWMHKRAMTLLDETLDQEALAAESRAEERAEEGRLRAHDLLQDDEERARWMDIFAGEDGNDVTAEPFDGLPSDPDVSSVETRLEDTERLLDLDRALGALTERRRRVVVHRLLDELETDDVAYLLDVPGSVVEEELAAGLRDLRTALRPRG